MFNNLLHQGSNQGVATKRRSDNNFMDVYSQTIYLDEGDEEEEVEEEEEDEDEDEDTKRK